MPQGLENYFPYLIGFAFLWCICGFGLTWYWMKKKGITFPDESSVNIKFKEKMASGCSHKSAIAKMGGGRNCLKVIVTDKELWITALFPFNLVAIYYDGIHRIPLSQVKNAYQAGKSVFVEFKYHDSPLNKFELRLKQPDKFIQVLQESS